MTFFSREYGSRKNELKLWWGNSFLTHKMFLFSGLHSASTSISTSINLFLCTKLRLLLTLLSSTRPIWRESGILWQTGMIPATNSSTWGCSKCSSTILLPSFASAFFPTSMSLPTTSSILWRERDRSVLKCFWVYANWWVNSSHLPSFVWFALYSSEDAHIVTRWLLPDVEFKQFADASSPRQDIQHAEKKTGLGMHNSKIAKTALYIENKSEKPCKYLRAFWRLQRGVWTEMIYRWSCFFYNININIWLMKFCPICFKLLLIQGSANGNRLVCKLCSYYYPLSRQQKIVIKYAK